MDEAAVLRVSKSHGRRRQACNPFKFFEWRNLSFLKPNGIVSAVFKIYKISDFEFPASNITCCRGRARKGGYSTESTNRTKAGLITSKWKDNRNLGTIPLSFVAPRQNHQLPIIPKGPFDNMTSDALSSLTLTRYINRQMNFYSDREYWSFTDKV